MLSLHEYIATMGSDKAFTVDGNPPPAAGAVLELYGVSVAHLSRGICHKVRFHWVCEQPNVRYQPKRSPFFRSTRTHLNIDFAKLLLQIS